jgi:hypothetical protein
LGKLESACTFEVEPANSPKELGRSLHAARNQVKSTMTDIEKSLLSIGTYRRRVKMRERHQKRLEKIRKKRLGK